MTGLSLNSHCTIHDCTVHNANYTAGNFQFGNPSPTEARCVYLTLRREGEPFITALVRNHTRKMFESGQSAFETGL